MRKIRFKISSRPRQMFVERATAFAAAVDACRKLREPQILMTLAHSGAIVSWEIVCLEETYDLVGSALVTLVDPTHPSQD